MEKRVSVQVSEAKNPSIRRLPDIWLKRVDTALAGGFRSGAQWRKRIYSTAERIKADAIVFRVAYFFHACHC